MCIVNFQKGDKVCVVSQVDLILELFLKPSFHPLLQYGKCFNIPKILRVMFKAI